MIKEGKSLYWTEPPELIVRKGRATGKHAIVQVGKVKAKYSQHNRIPQLGEQIVITVNAIGPARVQGYFIEEGWMGVLAWPLQPPAWYKKQNSDQHPILRDCVGVYGAEFEFIK